MSCKEIANEPISSINDSISKTTMMAMQVGGLGLLMEKSHPIMKALSMLYEARNILQNFSNEEEA